MFILSKRNVILLSSDGSHTHFVPKGFIGNVPDWATETRYFEALVADGKIVPTAMPDKALQAAEEKAVKVRRGKAEKAAD